MQHIYILSGPAGVGKTTLWESIYDRLPRIERVVTTTSRKRRTGEVDGRDYYFLSKEEFLTKINSSEFIEYAVVHTNYYGSTFTELERIIADGRIPLYIIEPQGMIHIKPILEQRGYRVTSVFLLPPSLSELRARIQKRGSETEEQFEIRMATAIGELDQQDLYDIKVTNDDFEKTGEKLMDIFVS